MTDTLERREAIKDRIINAFIATRTPAPPGTPDWGRVRFSLECELFARAVPVILGEFLAPSPRVDEGRAQIECERDDLLSTLIYVSTALPVLRTMLSAIHADKAEAQADTMIRLVQEALDRTDAAALATTPADPLVAWATKLAASIALGEDAGGVSRTMPNGKRYILMDWETYQHDVRVSRERGQATADPRVGKIEAAQRVVDAVVGSNADMHTSARAAYLACCAAARATLSKIKGEG